MQGHQFRSWIDSIARCELPVLENNFYISTKAPFKTFAFKLRLIQHKQIKPSAIKNTHLSAITLPHKPLQLNAGLRILFISRNGHMNFF
jgi:hypothetical protein